MRGSRKPSRVSRPEDFLDAHRRHWDDAQLLCGKGRLANADHLYGLSAECGLKSVMRIFKVTDAELPAKYKLHIDKLWAKFETWAANRMVKRHVRSLPPGMPFSNWSVSDRYASGSHFDKATVIPHRDAARVIKRMVDRSVTDIGGATHDG